MFSHRQIWFAIDRLADHNGLSPSGLARRAGLDPTTFNKSKRFAKDGRARWPSTESIAKILAATETTMETFYSFISSPSEEAASSKANEVAALPLLNFSQTSADQLFNDNNNPSGPGWQSIQLPNMTDSGTYALKVSGDSMLPIYRDGDIILVSTIENPIPGDRILLKTVSGEIMAKVLVSAGEDTVNLMSFDMDLPRRTLDTDEVEWLARITWASQ